MGNIRIVVGQYRLTESGDTESTIITSNNWPDMIDKAGIRGQWLELALVPLNPLGGDWSLLEETQDCLRKTTHEIDRLRAEVEALREDKARLMDPLLEMVQMMDNGDEAGAGSEWHQNARQAIVAAREDA